MAEFLRRPLRKAGPDAGPAPVLDPELLQRWPALFERMLVDRWPDGAVRATDTLFIFCDGERFKLMLKDRDAGRVGFVSSLTLLGLFDAAEALLRDDAMDWRPDRQTKGKGRG